MIVFETVFERLGLRQWCNKAESNEFSSVSDLMAKLGKAEVNQNFWDLPQPSLDTLNKACSAIPRSRDFTAGVEQAFLNIKDPLKVILDPLTQPLSWAIDGTLYALVALPWWIVMVGLLLFAYSVARSIRVTLLVFSILMFLTVIDHYEAAIQTLAIVFVCGFISVLLGIPLGIAMSRSDPLQRSMLPVLDMLQTLPTFVYLIPLIFMFSVTESKLYGIAIIGYAIVPVIRLTDLGIRLVDKDVLEAVDAFGMPAGQKLLGVTIPLAMPTIMAGINQTIMMALAMVVIASLVSAPGLGELVLQGISRLELGVGLVAGLGIVLLAIMIDRVSKAALKRINKVNSE